MARSDRRSCSSSGRQEGRTGEAVESTLPTVHLGPQGKKCRDAADNVETLVIPGVGHWLAEQAPEALVGALTTFLAPYRDVLVTTASG